MEDQLVGELGGIAPDGDAVAHFSKHPVTVSMTKQESGGFSHL
jgi:hypothetical protein